MISGKTRLPEIAPCSSTAPGLLLQCFLVLLTFDLGDLELLLQMVSNNELQNLAEFPGEQGLKVLATMYNAESHNARN